MNRSRLLKGTRKRRGSIQDQFTWFLRSMYVLPCWHAVLILVVVIDQNEKQKPTMTEIVTADQKLSPSDEKTHAIASKFQALTLTLTILAPTASQTISCEEAPQPLSCRCPAPQTYSTPATPKAYSAPASPHSGNASFGEQIWDMGVVEKVEEAVTSLLRNESSKYSTAANSAPNTQISANACSAAKS